MALFDLGEWHLICLDSTGEAPYLANVNLESRDLHGSSSELPLGFALRAHTPPEVFSHCRAFLF